METTTPNPDGGLTRAIDHARQGHAHAQQVITFVDTKSGILLTYSFAVVAGPLWLLQSACEGAPTWDKIWEIFHAHPWTCFWGSASLLAWLACVTCCLESVSPRKPPAPRRLMLFPYFPLERFAQYEAEFQEQMRSFSLNDEVAEFSRQLAVLGVICERKVFWHRMACGAFRWQLIMPGVVHLIVIGAQRARPILRKLRKKLAAYAA